MWPAPSAAVFCPSWARQRCNADVQGASPRPATSTVVNEGLARWTYEGQTGYGIAEYLHQLDAESRPVVPIE